jgi:hypothetical protein
MARAKQNEMFLNVNPLTLQPWHKKLWSTMIIKSFDQNKTKNYY